MTPRFVLDEQLRGPLWNAVQWHNRRGAHLLDVVRVGDPPELQLGASDVEVLRWAESEGRIIVSNDRSTLVTCFEQHLGARRHSAGLFLLRPLTTLPRIIEFLVAVAHASESSEWVDVWRYIP